LSFLCIAVFNGVFGLALAQPFDHLQQSIFEIVPFQLIAVSKNAIFHLVIW